MSCVQKKEVIVKIKIKKKVRGEGSGEMCTKNGSYCREKDKKKLGGGVLKEDANEEVKLL